MQNVFCMVAIFLPCLPAVLGDLRANEIRVYLLDPRFDFGFNHRVGVAVAVIAFIPDTVDVISDIKTSIVFPGPDYSSVPD